MKSKIDTVLDMTADEAHEFFMRSDSYCTLDLPRCFTFDGILKYVETTMRTIDYSDWLKDKNTRPSKSDTCNYHVQIAKNNSFAYRTISFVNPYLYYLLVRDITENGNWEMIKDRMTKLQVSWIERLAIPGVPRNPPEKSRSNFAKGEQILDWWERFEQRSLELSLEYRYMLCTDIADCYPSIYTHSISWALHGREEAKKAVQGDSSAKMTTALGSRLDTYITSMQSGETLGIPQGSKLFDFIAELVLAYADKNLEKKLGEQDIKGIHVLRYRDDYRIFSNSLDDLKIVSVVLGQVLNVLHLNLNASKTYISEEPLRDAIKKDKLARIERGLDERRYAGSSIQKQLLLIREFSEEYPNSGSVTILLNNVKKRIEGQKDFSRENIPVLVAIVVDILMQNQKQCAILITILSQLTVQLAQLDSNKRSSVLEQVIQRLKDLPQVGYVEIWMTYLLLRQKQKVAKGNFSEPLCRFLENKGQPLWDITWLKDEHTKGFPLDSICDPDWIKNASPSIPSEETELFESRY